MPVNKTMRISGGLLRNQRFLLPPMVDEGSVRPTPERVREAIFSILVHDMKEAKVLDLFAGSGAYGFESISRGASLVTFVEKDPRVMAVIRENIARLKITPRAVTKIMDAETYVANTPSEIFDVIFVDPPYSLKLGEKFFLALTTHLSPHGVVVFRCFKKETPSFSEHFFIDRDRTYASVRVFVLRRT